MSKYASLHPLVLLLRALTWLLRQIPVAYAERIFGALIRGGLALRPKYRRIAIRNLEIAYPEATPEWREEIYQKSVFSLARILIDFARMPTIDQQWVDTHVSGPFRELRREVKARNPGKGVLLATGHVGSFELLAHCLPHWGDPIAFVVRNFKLEVVDRWWTAGRERLGNKVINRQGAFKDVFRQLQSGRDVALLFDQNVTRNHATFVPLFGKEAATTKTLALAVLRLECPVLVVGIRHQLGTDNYQTFAEECDFKACIQDQTLSKEEKIRIITAELSTRHERLIRIQPELWFWFHRRWRTRPTEDEENPYAGC